MFPKESDEVDPSILMANYAMDDLLALAEDNEVKKGKRRIEENTINDEASSESKKSVRRDFEKQRRQEMATLYASLRSLLPLQYVKGKRAASDHMEQAVNYIKDTQNKIEETKMRRNKLDSERSNMNDDSVKVNLLRDDEMEILITAGCLHHDQEYCFPISKVLAYLLELGLNVTTYVSTRSSHHHSFHKLQIQLNESTSIDTSEMKQRLVNLIN